MATAPADPFARQRELLDEWLDVRAQINRLEARGAALLAQRIEVMDADAATAPVHREAIRRSMVAEYSAAGRMAKGSVEQAFAEACALRDDFPALRASYAAGRVSATHVREIIRAAAPLMETMGAGTATPADWALYEAAALEFAETEAPARTRAHVRELVAALVPQTVTERHRAATAEQVVSVRELDDEMSMLQAIMPTYKAVAILDRLTAMARAQKQHPENRRPTLPTDIDADIEFETARAEAEAAARAAAAATTVIFGTSDTYTTDPFDSDDPFDPFELPGAWEAYDDAMARIIAAGPTVIEIPTDSRGLDEIRTELLSDLLLSANPSEVMGSGLDNVHARIQVTVAATTLAGDDDHPGQLDGHGTLHPDIARHLAGATTGWTRLFLDPTGLVTETDTYTPTEPMRRFLRTRDQHCRFPGCRMPVHRCEIDHTIDWALDGPTSVDNLAHLCLTHHALKHPDVPDEFRWTARQLPDWTLEWTSPAGRTHLDKPPRRVMFAPSDHSPPEAEQVSGSAPRPPDPPGRWTVSGEVPPWEASAT
ncbi:HNH endonuclease [Microbacterium sp. NPDC089987]|uniref:HNH endonuclease signature motif containing protein n=1 Tax=Microbacterium sp. NPDC089987 TaxID=3364202 RepID=UPI00381E9325